MLTKIQQATIDRMGSTLLRTHTETFPPYAEYLWGDIPMRIQYRTFEALRTKGAIKHKHSNAWGTFPLD